MRRFEVRWQNFRAFEDTGWLEIRPITVVIGANATGKTTFVAPILILKQTLESSDLSLALKTKGDYFNAGSYEDLIFGHDTERTLSFGFRFKEARKPRKAALDPVGTYPPGLAEFEFATGGKGHPPVLSRYEVRDIHDRQMLVRKLESSGEYSVSPLKLRSKGTGFHTFIRQARPERFLFSAEGPFRKRVEEQMAHQKKERQKPTRRLAIELQIDDAEERYLQCVSFTAALIESVLREVTYIGPLREHPHRLYEVSGERPLSVGIRGEHTPEILFREAHSKLIEEVNQWVSAFDFGCQLQCKELTEGAFNITLQSTQGSPIINLADTGFGISQVLPLIVQGLYGHENTLLIAEQPEIHLNPRLQALLADLFCRFAARKLGVLVETHSEHLLLRLRRLIAEGQIQPDDVALYYAERHADRSHIRMIPIDRSGHIEVSDWPKGFFQESLRESLGLASAQAKE